MKDENDNRIMNPLEVNERYAKYFETLYQTREPEEGIEEWIKLVQDSIQAYEKNLGNEMNKINAPITKDEIRNAN